MNKWHPYIPGFYKQGMTFHFDGHLLVQGEIEQSNGIRLGQVAADLDTLEATVVTEQGYIDTLQTEMDVVEARVTALEDEYGYISLPATALWAGSVSAATPGEVRNLPTWVFADAATQRAVGSFTLPDDWDDSVNLTWIASIISATAKTGNVRIQVVLQSIEDGTEFIAAWDRYSNAVIAAPGTDYYVEKSDEIDVGALSNSDTMNQFGIQVRRDGAHADDTCTDAIDLIGLRIKYKRKRST